MAAHTANHALTLYDRQLLSVTAERGCVGQLAGSAIAGLARARVRVRRGRTCMIRGGLGREWTNAILG